MRRNTATKNQKVYIDKLIQFWKNNEVSLDEMITQLQKVKKGEIDYKKYIHVS